MTTTEALILTLIALALVLGLAGKVVVDSSDALPEENDYAVVCHSGNRLVYEKTSPEFIDFVVLSPTQIVVEDDDGTTNILNAACVLREP